MLQKAVQKTTTGKNKKSMEIDSSMEILYVVSVQRLILKNLLVVVIVFVTQKIINL